MKIKTILLCLLAFSASMLNAKIKVASILGDNMVLQRNSYVKLLGKAEPNQKIKLSIVLIKVIYVFCFALFLTEIIT